MPSEQHGHLRSGDHEPDGIVLLHGPHIAHTVLQDAAIVDIAPTLLHLMGEPVRSGMDGKVLQGALRETGEVRFVDETDDELVVGGEQRERDDDALAQRLRDLGYL
jgi:arylsulfatase A-like enzyme